jgi:predicted peptidase
MPSEGNNQSPKTQYPRYLPGRSSTTLWISLILSFCLLSMMVGTATAAGPGGAPGEKDGNRSGGGVIGVVSTALECLSVPDVSSGGDDSLCDASGIVRLTWQGQAERARLVLDVAGTNAAHTIRVNGKAAALSPVCSDREACSDKDYFYLSIAPEILLQGNNLIELTDDALIGDSWTATHIRLEVFGDLTPSEETAGSRGDTGDVAISETTRIFTFNNSYDESSQEALYQLPNSYTGNSPTPLVIYAHGRNGTMEYGLDDLGGAANAKGWLLASPQMHGSWVIPEECFDYPNDCDYDDKILTGTRSETDEAEPGAYAHASLESQYDIIGTAKYMVDNFNVKHDQIYLVGYSMGGQIVTVTAAKFPHLFAAVFDNKGITDLGQWYLERDSDSTKRTLEKECHIDGARKTPTQNPFCYERRSSVNFARNYAHIPISMTHSAADMLVPISHSRNLRDAINSYEPDWTASIYVDGEVGPTCPPDYHCYEPNPPISLLNWLEPFSLNNNPSRILITSDESKSYYWMSLAQTGGDHWSHLEVTRHPDSPTVSATLWDGSLATLAFNLGSTPMRGEVIDRPGMGLPATTYLVKGGGNNALYDYTSGNLAVSVATTGESAITISAITVMVSAEPPIVSIPQAPTSAITVLVRDHLGNSVPDGTSVQLSTTAGTFPNGLPTYTRSTTDGQATTTLTMGSGDDEAQVVATVRRVSGSISVQAVHPDITVRAASQPDKIYQGQSVNYQYQVTNTGDTTLSQVTVVDDGGTPGIPSDDAIVCSGMTLAAGATTSCSRTATVARTTTIVATVTGRDPLGGEVNDSDAAKVTVIAPGIDLRVTTDPPVIFRGETVTYQYQVKNTGDAELTAVTVMDDNGTPGNSADDISVCTGISLASGATTNCNRVTSVLKTTTTTARATGRDPLGAPWTDSDQATVQVGVPIYLPLVIAGR